MANESCYNCKHNANWTKEGLEKCGTCIEIKLKNYEPKEEENEEDEV